MTPTQRAAAQQALEKIAKAHTKIDALCLGNERWTMSVPIRPDHDHDLVISGALYAAAEFIRAALAEQPAEQEPVAPAMYSEIALMEKAVKRVGMVSLLNHGAASCVYTEGCEGVSQDHLLAYTREIALHCAAALSQTATPEAPQPAKPAEQVPFQPDWVNYRQGLRDGWTEGYEQGIADERTSEANIGIAGFGAKVSPARVNPYKITAPQPAKRVPLTDDEIARIRRTITTINMVVTPLEIDFARAVIAAYDAKNGITGDTK